MNSFFVGNNIVGNYKSSEPIDDVLNSKLQRVGDSLYLLRDNKKIRLNPVDEESSLLITELSPELPENNPAIYRIELHGDNVVVVLYTNRYLISLKDENKVMVIHLRIDDERFLFNKGRLADLFGRKILFELLVSGVFKKEIKKQIATYSKEELIKRVTRSNIDTNVDLRQLSKDEVVEEITNKIPIRSLFTYKELNDEVFSKDVLMSMAISDDSDIVPLLEEIFINNVHYQEIFQQRTPLASL